MTSNRPAALGSTMIEPVVDWPSPQSIVAAKSAVWAPGLPKVKVATVPENVPAVGATNEVGVAVSGASATVNESVGVATMPAASPMMIEIVFGPAAELVWPPITLNNPAVAGSAAIVASVVVPSPQLIEAS